MPYRHEVHRLDNNLEVVTVQMPHLHVAQVALLVRVGSRNEAPEENGLSHMIEHMFFRGCEGYPDSTAINAAMEDLGGHIDGYTTRDHSGYTATVHPAHVGKAISILGQMFCSPRFDDIDIERRIILEEMLDALDERGQVIDIDSLSHQLHFGRHGLGQSIEGPRKNVRKFNIDHLISHREKFYGTKNMLLCIAGSFDVHDSLEAAKVSFSSLIAGVRSTDNMPPSVQSSAFKSKHTDDPQTRIRLSFRTVAENHLDFPALAILRRLLDGGLSARLQTEIVEKRGLVYEIGADLLTYSDTGTFDIEFAAAHRNVSPALTTLIDILNALKDTHVTNEELSRVQQRLKLQLEMGLDSIYDMIQYFGVDHLFGLASSPNERLKLLSSVDAKQILAVAQKHLSGDSLTTVAVGGAKPKEMALIRKTLEKFQSTP